MTTARWIALAYAVILAAAAALNYIPGLVDADGLAFGIFALDIFDDALHAASALWALVAGLMSHRAARNFLLLFGALYLGDGALGLATGSGYLDLGIFNNGVLDLPFGFKILANLPHIGLGAVAPDCRDAGAQMRWLWRLLLRLVGAIGFVLLLLLAPVGYVELACRGEGAERQQTALLPPEHHRAETRTLLTYPEWHIVHAYDDYAAVIATDAPHHFGFLRAIGDFWGTLCILNRRAAEMGEVTGETKLTIYTIGVSFTAELAMKALYEETLGRLAVAIRGADRAPLDDLSAQQAADYAQFLQQTPWYKWNFRADAAALAAARTDTLRDRERAIALGLEYRAKAAYAGVIGAAVAEIGADALTLRLVVTGIAPADLRAIDGVTIIGPLGAGQTVIETPRYRVFTTIADTIAQADGDFVEIAGNDEILFTLVSPTNAPDALSSFARQGRQDQRHLMLVRVAELAQRLRALQGDDARLEHIHDY